MTEPATRELEWLRRARNGDEAAFAAIITAERPRARAVAWRLTGDATVADDVVQDAFVRLHRALADFREDAAVATWLYRTIVNLCHDRTRREAHVRATVPLDDVASLPADTASDAATEALDRTRHVNAAVALLPAAMRDVVVLRYVRGLGYDEIAETLRCSPGTVASRIHRALRAIGVILAAQGIREDSL